jgi:hypothetical protein
VQILPEWRQFSQITNFSHGFETNLSTFEIVSIHILSFIAVRLAGPKGTFYQEDSIKIRNVIFHRNEDLQMNSTRK